MKGWGMVSKILQVLLRRVGLGVGQFGAESSSSQGRPIRIPLAVAHQLWRLDDTSRWDLSCTFLCTAELISRRCLQSMQPTELWLPLPCHVLHGALGSGYCGLHWQHCVCLFFNASQVSWTNGSVIRENSKPFISGNMQKRTRETKPLQSRVCL